MTIDVISIINHEDYDANTLNNDIAILELAEEADLRTYTPACMAKSSDTKTFDGKNAWVYGEIDNWEENTNSAFYLFYLLTHLYSCSALNCK